VAAVDADVQVQAVVLQQHGGRRRGVPLVADELSASKPVTGPFFSVTNSAPPSTR
jgi:hypothetical protein